MSRFEQARSSLVLIVPAAFLALLAGVAFSLWSSTEGPDREPTAVQAFQDRPTTRTAMEELPPAEKPATEGVDSESPEETSGPSSPLSSADLTQAISDERELLRTVGRMSVDELIESELVNPHGIELSKLERRWLQSLMDQEQLAVEVAWTEFGEVKHQLVRRLRDSGEFERIEGHPKGGRPEPTRPGQITMYSSKDGVLGAVRIDPDRFPELERAREVGWQAKRGYHDAISAFFLAPHDPGPSPFDPEDRKKGWVVSGGKLMRGDVVIQLKGTGSKEDR